MKKIILTIAFALVLISAEAFAKVVFLPVAGRNPGESNLANANTAVSASTSSSARKCKSLGYKYTYCATGGLTNQCPYNGKYFKTCETKKEK